MSNVCLAFMPFGPSSTLSGEQSQEREELTRRLAALKEEVRAASERCAAAAAAAGEVAERLERGWHRTYAVRRLVLFFLLCADRALAPNAARGGPRQGRGARARRGRGRAFGPGGGAVFLFLKPCGLTALFFKGGRRRRGLARGGRRCGAFPSFFFFIDFLPPQGGPGGGASQAGEARPELAAGGQAGQGGELAGAQAARAAELDGLPGDGAACADPARRRALLSSLSNFFSLRRRPCRAFTRCSTRCQRGAGG